MRVGGAVSSWDDGGSGTAIVMATSRHKARLDLDDALHLLAEEVVSDTIGYNNEDQRVALVVAAVDWLAEHAQESTWRSVTKTEITEGTHDCMGDWDCDEGSWCTAGQGKAWVDVLSANTLSLEEHLEQAVPDE
jgi:hypothetical protein